MIKALTWTALAELPRAAATAVEPALREVLAAGKIAVATRWPEAPPMADPFAHYLAGKLSRQPRLAETLSRLRVEDLFLAWWAQQDPDRGIPALWGAHHDDLERLVARFHRLDREELLQGLRVKLFVAGAEGRPPRIATYSGFGFLQNWLRVLASRAFLDASRELARRRSTGLEEVGHDDDAPLLALIVEPGRAAFALDRDRVHASIRAAFAAAVAGLPPRERTFLRLATVNGLTLEQIAAAYQVGRATVARALASARARLRDDTRRRMIELLGIAPVELSSLIRDLESQLELSLARVLAMPSQPPTGDAASPGDL